jgi:hypothetical protein
MGAPSAPAIAAMAKILFRMQKLLRDDARAGFAAGTQPSQFIARGIVPGTAPHDSCNFWHFSYARNLSQRSASAIVEPRIRIKSRS